MASIFKLVGEIIINNEKANSAIDETTKKASNAQSSMSESFKKIGTTCLKVGGAVGGAAVAVGTYLYNLAENTREYRTEMGKLDTAFVTNGYSSETAKKTYQDLQAVLGDTGQAVEAANHLAMLTTNAEDLQEWTNICTGVFATFGDSLPIEGLTEAANEASKVGEVVGPLADALNWAGASEDELNEKLKACSTDQERQTIIMQTLNELYGAAAEQYKATNQEIMASNAAHNNLSAAVAGLGEAAEPAVTVLVNAATKIAEAVTPIVTALAEAVVWLGDAWVAMSEKITDITATITVHTNGVSNASASSGAAVTEATGSSFWGSLAENFIRNSTVNPDAPWLPTWRAEGAIFSKPTIFNTRLGLQGVGEAGPEAVAPIDKLQGYVRDAVRDTVGGMQFNVVLDSGILVGQLAPRMDAHLGTISGRKGRGN